MKKLTAVAVMALVGLTGCSPDTSAAYKLCFETHTIGIQARTDITADEKIDVMAEAGEACLAESKADPDAFNEKWSD